MAKVYLVFESKADCNYFISIQADHWWWISSCMYNGRRINDIEIELDDSFCSIFNNPLNKEPLHKGLNGKITLKQ
jgi:hypothetical protein